MIVGAGVFITIPFMLKELPGPYALLGWLAAGGLMLVDGLIWSELGAAMPGSGGSYLYLLECYGRNRWGRLMAFLFIWQFLISGPLEIASGVIALEQFSSSLHPSWKKFNDEKTLTAEIGTWNDGEETKSLTVSFGPTRILGTFIILGLLVLLYRRISTLGKWTVTFWLGVLGAIAWILLAGGAHFHRQVVFDYSGEAASWPDHFWLRLGKVMILAMYSYLGYYNICYIGDEVRDPLMRGPAHGDAALWPAEEIRQPAGAAGQDQRERAGPEGTRQRIGRGVECQPVRLSHAAIADQ